MSATGIRECLRRQPELGKWITHLYQQSSDKRLGLIVGAGISVDAGVPLWRQLIDRIAEKIPAFSDDAKNHRSVNISPSYFTQIAFQRFREHVRVNNSFDPSAESFQISLFIQEEWARLVHDCLYRDVKPSVEDVNNQHPYLRELCRLAYRCPLVVNFNFDDILSDSMRYHMSKDNFYGVKYPLAPDVVWKPRVMRRTEVPTILHVNGLLPRTKGKKRSETLVFTENSFADSLVSINTPNFEQTLSALMASSNLIIGHSLEDASLRNLLRSSRLRNPSLFNYTLYWLDSNSQLSDDARRDIFEVNLDVYNLITIFATTEQISELLVIINSLNDDDFNNRMRAIGCTKTRYLYYVVGPVASGKTSTLEHLRFFKTYEEWLANPPPEMYKDHTLLSDAERVMVAEWVTNQLVAKNNLMRRSMAGFFFMDRAPLDAFAFSKSVSENAAKGQEFRKAFDDNTLEPGEIIFLEASGRTLELRNLKRGRFPDESGDADYLEKQGRLLKSVYMPTEVYSTERLDQGECARLIVLKVLLGAYQPTNLYEALGRGETLAP